MNERMVDPEELGGRTFEESVAISLKRIADVTASLLEMNQQMVKQHGCICPPTSEATCQSALCPRRSHDRFAALRSGEVR